MVLHSGSSITPLLGGTKGFHGRSGRERIKGCPARHIIAFSPTVSLAQWQLSTLAGEDQATMTLGNSCGALRLVHTSPSDCSCAGKKILFCSILPPVACTAFLPAELLVWTLPNSFQSQRNRLIKTNVLNFPASFELKLSGVGSDELPISSGGNLCVKGQWKRAGGGVRTETSAGSVK